MIARGNLCECLKSMLHAFHIQHYPFLSILHNDRGNYYTVVTEEELDRIGSQSSESTHRMLFRGTHKELLKFCKLEQTDLFPRGIQDAQSNLN